jgi:D-serine deaminase-like pyridoxal phosphate-dependent protein
MLAHMQMAAGAIGITCAKVGEAEVLAAAGIEDILIANQVIGPAKIARFVNLAHYCDIMCAVDSATNAREISQAASAAGVRPRVLIEVNVGMDRCGVEPGRQTLELAEAVAGLPGLRFAGLMGYEGHAVMIPDPAQRRATAESSIGPLVETAELVRARGIPVEIVSSGGTPTAGITGKLAGITEIQAGSYITMDAQYGRTVQGVDFKFGLTVLATVVSSRSEDHAIVDAGLKAITRDFGMPLVLDPPGWEVAGLSEEHGGLQRVGGEPLRVGDRVRIVPNHGCTTINLHDEYCVIRDGCLQAVWPIAARGKTY